MGFDPLGTANLVKAVEALQPVLRETLNHASMLINTIINRLDGMEIDAKFKFTIPPDPGRPVDKP